MREEQSIESVQVKAVQMRGVNGIAGIAYSQGGMDERMQRALRTAGMQKKAHIMAAPQSVACGQALREKTDVRRR